MSDLPIEQLAPAPVTSQVQNGIYIDPTLNLPTALNGASESGLIPSFVASNGTDWTEQNTYLQDGGMPAESQNISADEIALYDRQIRLWGVKAQEKLRSAKILLIGMKALANEIAKNLVLAGVGSLTILDHEMVTDDDLAAQFFVSEEHIGQNRAEAALPQLRKLNPRVALFADPGAAADKFEEYYSTFDITIATNLNIDILSSINAVCRIQGRKFYAADTHGMYGYVFADLILHDFVVEREKGNKQTEIGQAETPTRQILATSTKRENNKTIEIVTKTETYSPLILANVAPLPNEVSSNRRRRLQVSPLLSCFRAVFDFQKVAGGRLPGHSRADLELFTKLATEKHRELLLPPETLRAEFLRSFMQNLGSEISPVVAFLGGALAQDVINVLGNREQPLQNFLVFDGEEFKAPVYSMHPIFDDTMTMPNVTGVGFGVSNGVVTDPSDTALSNGTVAPAPQTA